jgi:hypothetical protein
VKFLGKCYKGVFVVGVMKDLSRFIPGSCMGFDKCKVALTALEELPDPCIEWNPKEKGFVEIGCSEADETIICQSKAISVFRVPKEVESETRGSGRTSFSYSGHKYIVIPSRGT